MVGAGTYDDPRRPQYAPRPGESGIVGFSYQVSDDGRFALVEFVARDRSAFTAILADRRSEVRLFEKGRARREDIELEFKKHKKDFDLSQFPQVAVP